MGALYSFGRSAAELTARLRDFGRNQGLTLYMTLLAAFGALLARMSGQRSFAVGTPIARRTRTELEALPGFFVNTLALRMDLSGSPDVREWLQRVREETLAAHANQDVPFERLVEVLQPARDPSRSPLFQAMFAMQNAPLDPPPLAGLTVEPFEVAGQTSMFDLTLSFTERNGILAGTFEYATALFDGETMARTAEHLQVLLEAMIADPQQRVARLPIMTPREHRRVVLEWNEQPQIAPGGGVCAHELFEASARRTPDATAALGEDRSLSYGELDAWSNRLARRLVRLGVGPESVVALPVARSLEALVAILGILKAGGAYLPLEPKLPLQRRARMVLRSGARVAVSAGPLSEPLPVASLVDVLSVDDEPSGPIGRAASLDQALVVLFTSGSTGEPKGVTLAHRGPVNYAFQMAAAWQLSARDRLLGFASLGFDASLEEMLCAWAVGASLFVRDESLLEPSRLLDACALHRVTVMGLPTAYFHQVVDVVQAREAAWPSGVRLVCIGGEQASSEKLERFCALPERPAQLVNTYGPTEGSVSVTCCAVTAPLVRARPRVGSPLGGLVPNARVYVLDEELTPVPIGVHGELCIGGVAVARGYVGQPDLTAERFAPDSLSGILGARLYRTGDVGRWTADGKLEFLGRVDEQVKIRGFRIEPAEVEAILLRQPGVRQCAVVAREDGGGRRLVAYVAPPAPVGRLRAALQRVLPDYMVPSAFVTLDTLPLTPNGKLDRRALPAPDPRGSSDEYVRPGTPLEELLVGIWMAVLRVARVGVRDNFFELGGHSLLATQVVARIHAQLRVQLPVRVLFDAPTVAGVAGEVQRLLSGSPGEEHPITTVARGRPLPLSFSERRLWFLDQYEPGTATYNMPEALRLRGALDVEALERSLAALVQRHEALRTRFVAREGEPWRVVDPQASFVLERHLLEPHPEVDRERRLLSRVTSAALQPFDLSNGPLFRATLVRLAEDEHLLLLAMHHIIADAWSLVIIGRELSLLYEGFVASTPAVLPPLSVQYADYAAWERGVEQEQRQIAQLSYWTERLAGVPALELPTDRPRPPVQSTAGAIYPFALDPELTSRLNALGREEGTTLFMTLLSAFAVLMARTSGQRDFAVGTAIAHRTRTELEALTGFFVNTLALRMDLSGSLTVRELLGRVREQTLAAYANQDVPFERLVEVLRPARDPSRPPLCQVLFTLQNATSDPPRLGAVGVEPFEIDWQSSKFDLTLFFEERAGALVGRIEYATALFDASTIGRMAERYRILLDAIVQGPEQDVLALPFLSDADRKGLSRWNATTRRWGLSTAVHLQIADQAARTPSAVAAQEASGGSQLTYAELERRSNQLARCLHRLGAKGGSVVGICLERSLDMLVAVVGILKSGAAYLPLEVENPAQRRAFQLRDSAAGCVVTLQRFVAELGDVETLCFDRERELLAATSSEAWNAPVSFASAAYVIYTSGSTGAPKGAVISHGAIENHVRWMTSTFPFSQTDVILQVSSTAFDASVWEMLNALAQGARLVLAPHETHRDIDRLVETIRARGVTSALLVPSLLSAVVEHPRFTECTTLQRVFTGAETLTPQLANAFRSRSRATLCNLYGPTEATINATYFPVDSPATAAVPIGRPIANVRCYVVDDLLQHCPVGIAGELYIAGDGIARGYANRPALTALKFLPDPFGEPGSRMYATGDLARWTAEGTLEFRGRRDDQVKVRGFRVELGEIEVALEQHEAIREALVVARAGPGGKQLVAYARAQASAPSGRDLRRWLEGRLPAYMVPAAVVFVAEWPLTPNGKVDRAALPAPDTSGAAAGYVGPKTRLEERLVGIWTEVLRIPRVGIHDNFFELGGHSLVATQVVARIRAQLGVDLPVRALFDAPTVAGLAEQSQRRLYRSRDEERPIETVARDGPLPLSFAERRLWFLDQYEPGMATYNMPEALRLRGYLDVGALEQSLRALVERHDGLRTRFVSREGEPWRVVDAEAGFALERHSFEVPASEAQVLDWVTSAALRPFDLAKGSLFRATLVRLSVDDHVLLLAMHHILGDAWSLGVIRRELSTLYEGFVADKPASLPALSIQYADYAAWERSAAQEQEQVAQLSYWKERLAAVPVLELPTDRPRPPMQSSAGAVHAFAIDPALTARLKALGREEGTTLFMTLLSAFGVLMARTSGQRDFAVGTPIAHRTRTELEPLVGCFVNTLALRMDVSGSPTVREWLGRVREQTLGAYANQDVPFERLVELLRPARDLSRPPLCQVLFTLQNAGSDGPRLGAVEVEPFEIGWHSSKFDLTMFFEERGGALAGAIEYATSLFDASTIARMEGHLRMLLEAMVADSGQRIDALPILTASERRRVLVEWNDTGRQQAVGRCIHELFEERVVQSGPAVAVVSGAQEVTYDELNARANALALRLMRAGVGPGRLVGVCVERSAAMVVALLAVLKAGGAYVPLDPSYPRERLLVMLEDAEPALVLTDAASEQALPEDGAPRWRMEEVARELERANAKGGVTGTDLAYVIYTSGSTGRPKGVEVAHHSVVNLLSSLGAQTGFAVSDVLLAVTSLSFDIAGLELYLPLTTGAKVVLAERAAQPDGQALLRLADAHAVTFIQATPSTWRLLLGAGFSRKTTIRALCGGEAVPPRLARELAAATLQAWNVYGPTETTIWSTSWRLSSDAEQVPIGRPLANTELYILDAAMQPVPAGTAGELWIGGLGLARGYHGRPDLTAERFVANPFGNGRLYRTGDMARYRPTGDVEFLGRSDHQVKVRGYRIELGEIESALMRQSAVRECVVVARDDGGADKRLVAYFTPAEVSTQELRTALQSSLPEYMIPSSFVGLASLPLTPNGKVDRKALPAPDPSEPAAEYVGPGTPHEELLIGIWMDVLRVARVGIHDNFFELGGHSLLATQVVARIQKQLGVGLPVRALFDAPTVARLAEETQHRLAGSRSEERPILTVARDGPLPLSFAERRLWFLDQYEPGTSTYNMPEALRLRGRLDPEALERALGALVQRHEGLRTRFVAREGEPWRVVDAEARFVLERHSLEAPAVDRERRALEWARSAALRPFDLSVGPLFRATLVRLTADEHVLLLPMHHIIGDAWSLGVIERELWALYEGFVAGKPAALPALSIQYADYAAWERAVEQEQRQVGQLSYWKERLAAVPALELPTDRPRPPVRSSGGATYAFALDVGLTAKLKALSREEGTTLFMTLLSAFGVLMARTSGQRDFAVGTPIAHRTRTELEPLVGFFVNTLALRMDLSGSPTVREWLGRVREETLAAYANQDVPFERLLEVLQSARDLSRPPLCQVLFNMQNTTSEPSRLGALEVEPFEVGSHTSKFDLTMFFEERGGALGGLIEYATSLFDASTIERMAEHLRVLLAAMVAHPDQRVGALPFLSDRERDQLSEWSRRAVDDSEHLPLRDLSIPHFRGSTTAHVVDDDVNPIPVGVVGELCIGGEGLTGARLARSDLTAERLVPDPFAATPGGRLYRTRTRARRLGDGEIAVLPTHGELDRRRVVVVATFAADPIAESLGYWLRELGDTLAVELAPFGQVFQTLLDPSGPMAVNAGGVNVVLLRLEDWPKTELASAISELAEVAKTRTPLVVVLCPSKAAESDTALVRWEATLEEALRGAPGVHLVGTSWAKQYAVRDLYEPHTAELGGNLYTPETLAAMGTVVARAIHRLVSAPFKVVVVDADNTLWKGVVGEDGVMGVTIDASRRRFQERLVGLAQSGMQVCVASKNEEKDVLDVFERRAGERPLHREPETAWRVNWQPTSVNIRSLAESLNLGLDSFVFLDDSAMECAEVEASCPEVLALRIPADAAALERLMDNLWAFDRTGVTEEDRQRSEFYRRTDDREQVRAETTTLASFLQSLRLEVEVTPMRDDERARVAQLTMRTNQFNCSTRRRTEDELALECKTLRALVTRVRDRFGDYGLVGAILYEARGARLRVDTFLLSCRALGRGVEHHLLRHLAQAAEAEGLSGIDIPFVATLRNQPARTFLESVGQVDEAGVFSVSLETARAALDRAFAQPTTAGAQERVRPPAPTHDARRTALRLAAELDDAASLLRAIEADRPARKRASATGYVAPRTPEEEAIARIWCDVLRVERIGAEDNFFELGGHSLLATQVVARIQKQAGVELPVRALFDAPTVAGLAERVVLAQLGALDPEEMGDLFSSVEQLSQEEAARHVRDTESPENAASDNDAECP